MSGLKRLQRAFFASVRAGRPVALAPLQATAAFSAQARFGVYADAYRLRLIDALADSFPAVQTLLGDEAFANMAQTYLAQHPSRHFSIRNFGHRLGDFLAGTAPYADCPALAEMARFEWALLDVFDAADAAPLTVSDLAAVPPAAWGGLCFAPQPALRRLSLFWNIPQMWSAIDAEGPPIEPEFVARPVCWVVWRQELRTLFVSLDREEAAALESVLEGASFAEMCERLAGHLGPEDAPLQAATYLNTWLTRGWFVA